MPTPKVVRQPSCGKVIFSQACVKNSVHRGVSDSVHAGKHPMGRHLPPWADPLVDTPWADLPLHRQIATAADGMHPTGTHSFGKISAENCMRMKDILEQRAYVPQTSTWFRH